jgi:hypothetical protein
MNQGRRASTCSPFLSVILLGCICLIGCTAPGPIARPDVSDLSPRVRENSVNGIVFQATVLDGDQTARLFSTDMAQRNVVPVLFVMINRSEVSCTLRREHFTARFGPSGIEPAMPGRAAVLLRDSSGSRGAAWAGYALLGILAAPSIAAAEKMETAAIEAHRDIMFCHADLPPGGKVAGYLFFESPVPPRKLQLLDLELRLSGNRNDLITLRLSNPYARDIGR